jgi:signal transduction histidine kinase
LLWVLLSYSFATDPVGATSITAIFTDITVLKKTERDLVYKNRELDTFVYKASHDLKAPLSSLMGLVDIARGELKETSAQQYLSLIERTVQKMDDVLQGLLEVTWIKQGALDPMEIHLQDLVQTILRSIEHAPGYDTVSFQMEIPDRYHVVSDVKMLNSILQNLIFNAVKYHREEGETKWVAIKVVDFPRHARISIQDNGPGIPSSAQERLFDMFYRASNKSKGSGLGLYIVKTSIEKMGGTVVLKSEEGVGTEFVVELPKMTVGV